MRFEAELEDHLTRRDAERTLRAVTAWGRYAELFTLQASAWYQHLPQFWPPQYLAGRDQAFRNAPRERAEQKDLRIKARPASHEVVEPGAKRAA